MYLADSACQTRNYEAYIFLVDNVSFQYPIICPPKGLNVK